MRNVRDDSKGETDYKRLLKKLRFQGLWRWRRVALAILMTQVPIQSGTVAVERLWNVMLEIFPRSLRFINVLWFAFLADLAYLRFNWSHFNGAFIGSWAKSDALLAQNFDSLICAARGFQDSWDDAPWIFNLIGEAYAAPKKGVPAPAVQNVPEPCHNHLGCAVTDGQHDPASENCSQSGPDDAMRLSMPLEQNSENALKTIPPMLVKMI